jgi:arginyl-tRNA synthetase
MKESEGEKIEFPENYYQGPYIFDIAREAKDKQIKFEELGDFAADFILDIIRKELDDFGVKFDYWSSQKELRVSGRIEKDLDLLKKNSRLYEQDGALWFKSSEFGDDKDRVVIKSDGTFTYLAPDICYHQEKYRRGFEWLINLWGPDHHGYISRLKASVAAFGHDPESLSVVIVQLATIFRDGKIVHMSTRKGQYITLREVLDEVGVDASRFFFVMRRTSSHLDFDLDVAKKQSSENPVFYVQYAHARISSILRQAQVKSGKDTDLSVLKEKEELALIKKILQFASVLNVVLSTLDPFMLTIYLQELSETFHKFYDQHRVLGQDEAITKARLALIEGASLAIAAGLELLGVSRPEKM